MPEKLILLFMYFSESLLKQDILIAELVKIGDLEH